MRPDVMACPVCHRRRRHITQHPCCGQLPQPVPAAVQTVRDLIAQHRRDMPPRTDWHKGYLTALTVIEHALDREEEGAPTPPEETP